MKKTSSPDSTREEAIASMLVSLVLAALLYSCEGAPAAARVVATLPANAVVIIDPPRDQTCREPGYRIELDGGVAIDARTAEYLTQPAGIGIVIEPAVPVCVFADTFEGVSR